MSDIIILDGDIRELCSEIPDNSIDMIFTDPPYPKEFLELFSVLGVVANRVLKTGGYLFTYTGQFYIPEVISNLSVWDMRYYWMCGTIHSGGTRIIRGRGAQNGWKPILVFSKGKPGEHRVFNDWYSANRSKGFHEWGQDEATAGYYIQCFSKPGDTILDPFCGGGTTAYACAQIDRNCITMDVDPKAIDTARERLKFVQKPLVPEGVIQTDMWTPEATYTQEGLYGTNISIQSQRPIRPDGLA